MFWLLVLAVASLGVIYYRWSRRRLYRLAQQVPSGLKTYPVIGHAYLFFGSHEGVMKGLQKVGRDANAQGGLSSLWLGPRLFVCMTNPTAIEVVTKTCLEKDGFTRKFTQVVLGNGSINAPVNIWHPRRKVMAHFFSLRNLNRLVRVFDEKSSIMADLMQAEAGGGDFPVWNYLSTYSFDTVGETVGGYAMNSQENSEHFLLHAINEISAMLAERIFHPWLHPDFIYERLPVFKRFQMHMRQVNTFLDEAIQNKRKALMLKNTSNNDKDWTNFIDTIVQSSGGLEKGFSDLEIREEVMVMSGAGSDTSATGASFTAVLLSRHPDVQEKVYQELQEVFGDSDRPVTAEDLPRLKYLEAVIKESLRLYPPGPVIVREVHKDTTLPCGTTLVAGTSIVINIWATHRLASYWGADAELFRPERFLEPLRHPAMFIAFSYSVRGCIGSTYAMYSAKTALANLLRRYRLLPPSCARAADLRRPLPVRFELMMRAADGFQVRIEKRKTGAV